MKRRYRCKNKLRTIDNSNSTSIFLGSTLMESVSTSMESVSTLANDTEGLQVINTLPNLGILIVNGSQEAIASLAVKADDEGSTIVTEQNKVVGMLQQTLPTGIDRVDAESNMENNTANNNSSVNA